MPVLTLLSRLLVLLALPLSLLAKPLPKQELLTGFTPVVAFTAAQLRAHLTGGPTMIVGTALRAPIRYDQPEWPLTDLTEALRAPWQRLAPDHELLLEVRARGLKPKVDAGFSLVWTDAVPKRNWRLSFRTGSSVRWKQQCVGFDATGSGWQADDKMTATGPPLHSIGWLVQADSIWVVADNRRVAVFPRPAGIVSPSGTGHLSLELDGGADQVVEVASVRLLAKALPKSTEPAPLARQPAAPKPVAASAPPTAAPARPAHKVVPLPPAARPAGLTLVASLSGERLKAVIDSLIHNTSTSAENGLVALHSPADGREELIGPLPYSILAAYKRRQQNQNLLIEIRARMRHQGPGKYGSFGLKLDVNNNSRDASLTYREGGSKEYGDWGLSASPSQSGTLEGTGPSLALFHTLGFFQRGDSLTVYLDDRPVGRTYQAAATLQALLKGEGNFHILLFGENGQELEVSHVRLYAQGETTFAAQHATEAAQDRATRPQSVSSSTGSSSSPTRTTASGVQYSTADMSQFTRKPGAVSGYSTGAGAASDKCSRCNGFGKINTRPNPCTYCGGTGGSTAFVPNRTWTERGPTGKEYHYQSTEGKQQFVACSHCAGGPTPVWAVCPTCHGTGH